jgi:hypothetical protein
MDVSPEAFAYRCLPLNIANAHGWEITTPTAFEACWNGSMGVDGVEVRYDETMPPNARPVSLFGQATFTIHIQGIFRTEPGWNLYVKGPPNFAKDGLAPLEAVIETDWSPYSFTMNWRFTRPHHWVRFEAGDPVCFFFPVQRGVLRDIDPVIAPLEGDVAEQFAAWSKSRDEFHAEMAQNPPRSPNEKWQKRYYRGIDMRDVKAEGHEAKLRLKNFKRL